MSHARTPMRPDFWERVERCKHKHESPNYCVGVTCGHEELGCSGGSEFHCLDCGAYVTEDPCGQVSGISGWPHKRWRKHSDGIWNSKKWSHSDAA